MRLHLLAGKHSSSKGYPGDGRGTCCKCRYVLWPRHGVPDDHDLDYTMDPERYERSPDRCTVKEVNSQLDGTLSLVDKTWNDAMETAALRCEDASRTLFGMNGGGDAWVWPAGRYMRRIAQDLREMKRGLPRKDENGEAIDRMTGEGGDPQ